MRRTASLRVDPLMSWRSMHSLSKRLPITSILAKTASTNFGSNIRIKSPALDISADRREHCGR